MGFDPKFLSTKYRNCFSKLSYTPLLRLHKHVNHEHPVTLLHLHWLYKNSLTNCCMIESWSNEWSCSLIRSRQVQKTTMLVEESEQMRLISNPMTQCSMTSTFEEKSISDVQLAVPSIIDGNINTALARKYFPFSWLNDTTLELP